MMKKGEQGVYMKIRKSHISTDSQMRTACLSNHVNVKAVYICLSGSIKRHIFSYQREKHRASDATHTIPTELDK